MAVKVDHPWFKVAFYSAIVIIAFLTIRGSINANKPRIVFACPTNSTSKCYKVVGKYVPPYCEEAGHCDPPYYTSIEFPAGGSIIFSWCEEDEKPKTMTCFAENYEKNGAWDITFTGEYAKK